MAATKPRVTGLRAAVVALAAALALAAPGFAAEPAEVDATGNPFTGGLGYDPPAIEVKVGQIVRWTNTDFFVPHTATEIHGLWDLAGDYGLPPISPTGFAPGESVERRFEAGAWRYYCKVHGADAQSGTVDVPVRVSSQRDKRKGAPRYTITARWSRTGPAEGQVFDVQLRGDGGGWRLVREGTRKRSLRLANRRKGTELEFRARVRSAEDRTAASGWSPPAEVRAD